ncbi:WW domain-containing oxidoreductase [Acrodontium crateriforme]|uniref:WW domain-containing oxidoreductase n=1 Tax=Acrodontium crateriforme TaxID=150365 RepID=A0AAQ3M5A9_9PEZI|nr:WW domain-containing oxidoreductase [Acrodontium crateriforme]
MVLSNKEFAEIPYDAPLSFQEPGILWRHYKGHQGTNSKKLTRDDVPFKDLTGKWIIISGSNNGIGREAALFFAQCGANLILACRNPPPHEKHPYTVVEECKAAARSASNEKSIIEWWDIDMTKLSTVDAFAKRWLDTGRPLDILCNNAGMGGNPGGLSGNIMKTEDGFEFVHQVNFTSHVLLTMRLLPALAKAPEPRIVCTTSCMTYYGKFNLANFDGTGCKGVEFYNNNKLYFQMWLTELHHRMMRNDKYKHITINGVHPGYVNSGIWRFETGKGFLGLIASLVRFFLQWLAALVAISTEQGSYCITNAATSLDAGPDPAIQGVGSKGGKGGGRYFNRIWEWDNMPHNQDPDARSRVWRKVDEELKLTQKGLLSWTD